MRTCPACKIIALGLVCSMLLLTGCSAKEHKAAKVSETAGAGRIVSGGVVTTPSETDEAGVPVETTDSPTTTTPVASEPTATLQNGKYVYSIPKPDRSGLSDLSDVKSLSRALFSDSGESTDWYYGKVERDLTTGEVNYVWDRAADTLALLDKYGAVYRKNQDEKVCYFTFDCGYENGWTEPILDVLKEKNVPGLFFVVGHYVETAPDIIGRMYDEGHLVGNHTYHHPNMATDVDEQGFIDEITSLEDALAGLYPDAPAPIYWRPPYGACNEWTLAMSQKLGLTTVLWSFAYYDYVETDQMDPAAALEKAKKGLHNGCVYLFHCVGSTNPAILGDLIDYIRGEGYEIRPMCQ